MSALLAVIQKLHKLLAKAGRGGSLPGVLALRLDKKFLSRFQMPDRVILVTGTNGKTTTMNLIAESLKANGLSVVCNHRGDNLSYGLATALAAGSDKNFRVQADAVVLEVDELTLYREFAHLHPTALVVTNFFRDQLDRAGELETIIRKIMEITENFEGDLIINGDDPNSLRLADSAKKARVHIFSMAETIKSLNISDEASEGKFCPRCGKPLLYEYYQYSHIGRFRCPFDRFGVISPDLYVDRVDFDTGTFHADGNTYRSFINSTYAIYNCAAVLCLLKAIHLDPLKANEVFSNYKLKEGRNEVFALSRPSTINLVKNPTGANEVMKYITAQANDKNICIFLNDNDLDGTDISWIWDAHFERLNDPLIHTIVCSGKRAYDMALRLKYEGLEDRIRVIEDSAEAISWLDQAEMDSYIIATYTALHATRAILRRQAGRHKA